MKQVEDAETESPRLDGNHLFRSSSSLSLPCIGPRGCNDIRLHSDGSVSWPCGKDAEQIWFRESKEMLVMMLGPLT
jgi:hypothetical protein